MHRGGLLTHFVKLHPLRWAHTRPPAKDRVGCTPRGTWLCLDGEVAVQHVLADGWARMRGCCTPRCTDGLASMRGGVQHVLADG